MIALFFALLGAVAAVQAYECTLEDLTRQGRLDSGKALPQEDMISGDVRASNNPAAFALR